MARPVVNVRSFAVGRGEAAGAGVVERGMAGVMPAPQDGAPATPGLRPGLRRKRLREARGERAARFMRRR